MTNDERRPGGLDGLAPGVTADLAKYRDMYVADLLESVAPFWIRHSLDREIGGYFTCLDRDGSVYDTRKYVWLQGRQLWALSRLCNQFGGREEWVNAAALGATFLEQHAFDRAGHCYFSLTREGEPSAYQRKPYSAAFVMLGFLEHYKLTRRERYLTLSIELFRRVCEYVGNPSLMGSRAYPTTPKLSSLPEHMMVLYMATELRRAHADAGCDSAARSALDKLARHYDADRRVFMDFALLSADRAEMLPETRLLCAGHSIETAWVILHALQFWPDRHMEQIAMAAVAGTVEQGWDAEYGGLYYFVDVAGRPPLQLEHNMKLWWPHTEALYALMLAYARQPSARWLGWLDKVHAYVYAHFPDPEQGEWFGYCDRLSHACKGGNYKGCYHVPRFQMLAAQLTS